MTNEELQTALNQALAQIAAQQLQIASLLAELERLRSAVVGK